jgi:WD40 repeat protein
VSAAKWSPSGYYIASGDVNGTVRVWDASQPEHRLKGEFKVLASRIHDIAWDSESARLIVAGDGRERYAYTTHIHV